MRDDKWADEHCNSNEVDTMHRPASEIDNELHEYCENCEAKFEEPQENALCEFCSLEKENKNLKFKIGELESRLKLFERFTEIIKKGVEENKTTFAVNQFDEGLIKEKELIYEFMKAMELVK